MLSLHVLQADTPRVDDVELSIAHPRKSFIMGALEKEIRLSFAQRIRGTLPEPYQTLIPATKEDVLPEFKYKSDRRPFRCFLESFNPSG